MKTIHRDIVGAAVISSDGKVVLGMHSKKQGGVYAEKWVVPGGGIEPGETRRQAIDREVMEEVRIDISGYQAKEIRLGAGESEKFMKDLNEIALVKMTFYDFIINIHDKTAKELGDNPTEEFHRVQWFSPTEIDLKTTSKPTLELMRHIDFISF